MGHNEWCLGKKETCDLRERWLMSPSYQWESNILLQLLTGMGPIFLRGQLVGVSSLQHHVGSRGLAPCQTWQQAPLLEMRSYCTATLAWHWLCSPDCSWSPGDHHLLSPLSCLESSCEKKHCFFRLGKTTTRHCLFLFWDSVSLYNFGQPGACLCLLRAGINSMCHHDWSFCTSFCG